MYPLTSRLVDFLVSDRAQVALEDLAQQSVSAAATLARLTALRRQFTPPQAAVLLDQARLRQRARAKFPGAERLLFTDEALQQASSHAIARFRALVASPSTAASRTWDAESERIRSPWPRSCRRWSPSNVTRSERGWRVST